MKQRGFIKGILCGVVMTVAVTGVVWLGGCESAAPSGKDSVIDTKVSKKLESLQELIESNYLYEDEVDQEALQDGILKGYIDGLGDPYSVYYNAEETKELLSSLEGEFSGIGVLVSQNAETKLITFVTVYEGSPAAKAGFRDGDVLYKVDGEDITSQDLDTVVAKMRGEKGTKVDITVVREGVDEEITATVTRDTVEVQTVASKMEAGKIGYIQISQFDKVTYEQFKKALTALQKKGAKGYVFDLRSNPGGSLDAVCKILDLLLPEGTIVSTKDKNGKEDVISSDAEHQLKEPAVVLVDGNSASASEIFAGAMQDYGVGTIVGTTTYGKGIVQQLFELPNKTCVKLTISEYFTPKGRSIHKKGVSPDVEVAYTPGKDGEDNQLEKALEVVRGKIK